MSLKLSHKGLILVAVPLIFEVGFVLVLNLMLSQAEVEVQREARARAISKQLNQLHNLLTAQATGISGYGLIGSKAMEKRYEHASDAIPELFQELRVLVSDNPKELKQVEDLQAFITETIGDFRQIKRMIDQGEQSEARSYLSGMRAKVPILAAKLDTIAAEERKIEDASPHIQAESRKKIKLLLSAGVLLNVLLAVSLAVYFNRGTTRRLGVLMDNTYRLASSKPLNPPLGGNDEIGHLDKVFNQMAAALAESAQKEREAFDNLSQSEARVRTIVETMPVGLVIMNSHGNIELVNPATEDMFDTSIERLIGQHVSTIFPKQATRQVEEFTEELLAKGCGHVIEREVQRDDGTTVPVELSVNEFQGIEGHRYMLVMLDISERKEVERLKQEFVSMVSHELRSPLTSVQGFLTLLAEDIYGTLNEQGKQKVHIADRNVTRLIKLINDLLDIDKLQSGKLKMVFKPVKISGVIERSIDSVRVLAEQENISIDASDSQYELVADGDRLVQVIVNLLSNAIKFSPRESTIKIAVTPQDGGIEVRVIDQGVGIPLKYHASIFERFEQVTSQDKPQKGGSGLGLTISRAIIEQHGGTIGLDSEEGKGCSFWFKLPDAPPAQEAA